MSEYIELKAGDELRGDDEYFATRSVMWSKITIWDAGRKILPAWTTKFRRKVTKKKIG